MTSALAIRDALLVAAEAEARRRVCSPWANGIERNDVLLPTPDATPYRPYAGFELPSRVIRVSVSAGNRYFDLQVPAGEIAYSWELLGGRADRPGMGRYWEVSRDEALSYLDGVTPARILAVEDKAAALWALMDAADAGRPARRPAHAGVLATLAALEESLAGSPMQRVKRGHE